MARIYNNGVGVKTRFHVSIFLGRGTRYSQFQLQQSFWCNTLIQIKLPGETRVCQRVL